ncbi:hypothetical protein PFISCL1PPCAC_11495, partial [Pristionchus fissidentatus]
CARKFARRVNNLEIQGRIEMDSISFPQFIQRIAPVTLQISDNEVDIFLIQRMVNGRDRWDFNLIVSDGGQHATWIAHLALHDVELYARILYYQMNYDFALTDVQQAMSRFEIID